MSAVNFWVRFVAFFLPFGIGFGVIVGGLVYVGELMPLQTVVDYQTSDEPVMYRPRFGNRDTQFKSAMVNRLQPEIVTVGSSRVLQMRDGLLTEAPSAFYNAGAPAWTLDQLEEWLALVDDEALPDVLILGIDPPWFNSAYTGDEFKTYASDVEYTLDITRSFLQYLVQGRPFDLAQLLVREERRSGALGLGMRPIQDGHGFRNDGSEQYGDFLVAGWLWQPTERDRHIQWMRNGEEMYVFGDTISPDRLAQFERFIATLDERGVHVVGFLPPYTPSLYAEMIANGNHRYIETLPATIESVMDQYDFDFLDFSDATQFGVTDEDFFDGWHGSERVYLRLFRAMAEALPDVFADYTDIERLTQIDQQAENTFWVFPWADEVVR